MLWHDFHSRGGSTLDPSSFAECLHQAMKDTAELERRHIIQFATAQDYDAFACHMNLKSKSFPQLRQVRPLRLIRAISCPLSSVDRIASAPFVQSVEADVRIRLHARGPSSGSSSLYAGTPAAADPEAVKIPWGIRHIRAPEVWSKSRGDQIRIAVIDTGADYSHPDLRHCLSRGINVLSHQPYPIDDNGHGTHIAGTIAAYTNQRGIVGVAPQALIHPVKAFDNQGGAFVSDIVKGIDWCVANGMDIINMSFGMRTYSKALEAAVLSAYRAGIIVIASSGNEGKRAEIDYPARFPQVIAVGATTRRGRIASFSNDGKQIDIYAPGENIYSTWLQGKYRELSGTSMATSHVTGVVALMLSLKPDLKPLRIRMLLRKNARLILKPGKRDCIKELHALRTVSALFRKKK
ncbi:S8 family serine peptidase [Paenibacillus validus]|uniref:S8 family serine peptidase n=2 Tax=Paenibacillus validus TaxID=44253 RepID=A0A7X2ZF73_9BACL|nr:S8 family serine peptidase [Paenibacillus validus]